MVLVTGAASGIGQATALEVAGRGGSVLGLDRSRDGLVETPHWCRRPGGSIETAVGDVGDEDAVAEAVARAVGAFGRLDGVVTCAGSSPATTSSRSRTSRSTPSSTCCA